MIWEVSLIFLDAPETTEWIERRWQMTEQGGSKRYVVVLVVVFVGRTSTGGRGWLSALALVFFFPFFLFFLFRPKRFKTGQVQIELMLQGVASKVRRG